MSFEVIHIIAGLLGVAVFGWEFWKAIDDRKLGFALLFLVLFIISWPF